MITKISIENFKGIGERVEIPIRPLTLLFGPNSAGKSTIMHAFHYAREVFERHNLDADRTIAGGEFIDLGGFRNFVHDHDVRKEVTIRIETELGPDVAPKAAYGEEQLSIYDTPGMETGWAETVVAWDDLHGRPFVKHYRVGFNDELLGEITAERSTVIVQRINTHELFVGSMRPYHLEDGEYAFEDGEDEDYLLPLEQFLDQAWEQESQAPFFNYCIEQPDALPPCGLPLNVRYFEADDAQADPAFDQPLFFEYLRQVFVGMADIIRDQLRSFCYVGPLREKPSRTYAPPRYPDPSRWATGLGAWDALHVEEEPLADVTNLWLSRDFTLDTGYMIWLRESLMLDREAPLYGMLVSHRAFEELEDLALELQQLPKQKRLLLTDRAGLTLSIQDVGEGIAQMLPVVVAALQNKLTTVQIEQPELHLHPKQQAALGDLLIQGALGKPPKVIVAETHSEHLILRVLRRIRETARDDKPPMGIPITPRDVAVYYVRMEEGDTKVIKIDVDDKGEFVQPWPDDFFEIDFYERFA